MQWETAISDLSFMQHPEPEDRFIFSTPHLHEAAIRLMLGHKPDLSVRDRRGRTALEFAVLARNIALIPLLIQAGADMELQNGIGQNLLCFALTCGHDSDDISRLVIDLGASVESRDENGHTALHTVHTASLAKLLLESGADVNAKSEDGSTPLLASTIRGHEETALMLLDAGAQVDDVPEDEGFILRAVLENNLEAVLQSLLERKINLQSMDSNGESALMWAARESNDAIFEMILSAVVDVDKQFDEQYTVLHLAARSGSPWKVSLLLARGADVHARAFTGFTPLHIASYSDSAETITILVEAGADINAKGFANQLQRTPLFIAATNDSPVALIRLLELGANYLVTDDEGQTPLDYALLWSLDANVLAFHPYLKRDQTDLTENIVAKLAEGSGSTIESLPEDNEKRIIKLASECKLS